MKWIEFKQPQTIYSYPNVDYIQVRLVTDSPSNFFPTELKDCNLEAYLGDYWMYLHVPSKIRRGYSPSGQVELAPIDQSNKLGIDGMYFYVYISATYAIPRNGNIINVGDVALYVVDEHPSIYKL